CRRADARDPAAAEMTVAGLCPTTPKIKRSRCQIDLAAALSFPSAGAAAALPGTAAGRAGEPARAHGALLAIADGNSHRTIAAHLAGNVDRGVAGIGQRAALDPNRVAIGAITVAMLGHDQHAPQAVIARSCGGGYGDRERGQAEARERTSSNEAN